MKQIALHLADEVATLKLGQTLAELLPSGFVIYLYGDLGAGKTTLVRGVLRGLGFEGNVKSPTYTLVEPYEVAGRTVYHFDLYRLADPEELEYAGGRDYFSADSICLVEWPEKGAGWLASADLAIHLNYQDQGRSVILQAHTDIAEGLLSKVST